MTESLAVGFVGLIPGTHSQLAEERHSYATTQTALTLVPSMDSASPTWQKVKNAVMYTSTNSKYYSGFLLYLQKFLQFHMPTPSLQILMNRF